MKSRLLVSAVGVPLIFLIFLWAPLEVLVVSLALLSGIAAFELTQCVRLDPTLQSLAILEAVFGVLNTWADIPGGGLVSAAFVLLTFAVAVRKEGKIPLLHILTAFFAMFAIPYSFSSFLRIYNAGFHRGFLMLPLVFSFISDTFAFFTGRLLGKHKLTKVSPHKTVEGAVGGLVGNMIGGVVFALIMDRACGVPLNLWHMALLGFLCSVVAQLGDLSFSLIKREFGVKDYGKIFFAHGGVLDRFDSVLFVSPVLELLLAAFSVGMG